MPYVLAVTSSLTLIEQANRVSEGTLEDLYALIGREKEARAIQP